MIIGSLFNTTSPKKKPFRVRVRKLDCVNVSTLQQRGGTEKNWADCRWLFHSKQVLNSSLWAMWCWWLHITFTDSAFLPCYRFYLTRGGLRGLITLWCVVEYFMIRFWMNWHLTCLESYSLIMDETRVQPTPIKITLRWLRARIGPTIQTNINKSISGNVLELSSLRRHRLRFSLSISDQCRDYHLVPNKFLEMNIKKLSKNSSNRSSSQEKNDQKYC